MQITVKSVKVGKTGTNKQGDWELIVVTSEDGTDYTTFHKGAKNLGTGAVIDIGEPVIKEGKISFKEYTVVSMPAMPPNGQSGMTPVMWAEKDRLERWSIESQVAFKGIIELMVAKVITKEEALGKQAIGWAQARLGATDDELFPEAENPPTVEADDELITPEQLKDLDERLVMAGVGETAFGKYCNAKKKWNIKTKNDLTQAQFKELVTALNAGELAPSSK